MFHLFAKSNIKYNINKFIKSSSATCYKKCIFHSSNFNLNHTNFKYDSEINHNTTFNHKLIDDNLNKEKEIKTNIQIINEDYGIRLFIRKTNNLLTKAIKLSLLSNIIAFSYYCANLEYILLPINIGTSMLAFGLIGDIIADFNEDKKFNKKYVIKNTYFNNTIPFENDYKSFLKIINNDDDIIKVDEKQIVAHNPIHNSNSNITEITTFEPKKTNFYFLTMASGFGMFSSYFNILLPINIVQLYIIRKGFLHSLMSNNDTNNNITYYLIAPIFLLGAIDIISYHSCFIASIFPFTYCYFFNTTNDTIKKYLTTEHDHQIIASELFFKISTCFLITDIAMIGYIITKIQ